VLEQVMAEHFAVPPRFEFSTGGVVYELNGSFDELTIEDQRISSPEQ
jgi:hypothetical protein